MFKIVPEIMRDAASDATAAAAVAAASAAAAGAKPWYDGLPPETVGYLQNKHWDKDDAKTVAMKAIEAHSNAEKKLGAPSDKLLRLPDNPADSAAMKAVWQRLGAPVDAKGYDFTAVKNPDGSAVDPKFLENFTTIAAANNLPKETAASVATELLKVQAAQRAEEAGVRNSKLNEQRAELQKNWGSNFEAHKFIAQQAAKALGVAPEVVAALEGQIGYSKTMEMFRLIGTKIGEDKFIAQGGSGSSPALMTQTQATARRAELMRDEAWVKSYFAGDVAKQREMLDLNRIIVGQAQNYA